MQWHSPWMFLLLLLVPPILWLSHRRASRAALRFSSSRDLSRLTPSFRLLTRPLQTVIRALCLILLIVALARPRLPDTQNQVVTKGVVMNLVVDRSSSMRYDMAYQGRNLPRIDTVKAVLESFLAGGEDMTGRQSDLLGLVTFARYADTNCPFVFGPHTILDYVRELNTVRPRSPEDSTSIGEGLALAAARLHTAEVEISRRNAQMLNQTAPDPDRKNPQPDFEIAGKVIILLTDGDNNAGDIDPLQAADLARKWGIKIYTIGVGGPVQVRTPLGPQTIDRLNEPLLRRIAQRTGGFYGRATDGQALADLFARIDKIEKSEIETLDFNLYEEKFTQPATAALGLLLLEIVLSCTLWRKIP